MHVVKNKEEIIQNIQCLEKYLSEGNPDEREFAIKLIKKGRCFVSYEINEEMRFAPSRFIGYRDNNMEKHDLNFYKDGRETNPAISTCLKKDLSTDEYLKKLHEIYCNRLGVKPDKVPKTFWEIGVNPKLFYESIF